MLVVAALALGCSGAAAQTRARAAAETAITLIEPGGLRTAEAFAPTGPGAGALVVAVSEASGAGYQLVTPARIAAGSLVIETADILRSGEGQARLPIGATVRLPAGSTAHGQVGLLPVTAVFD